MEADVQTVPADELPDIVIELSAELLAEAPAMAAAMAAYLHAQIPELRTDHGVELDQTRTSCESNLLQSFGLLHQGAAPAALVVPPQAQAYVRAYIDRGLTLPVLLRTYRLGHAWMWEHWSELLRERIEDPDQLATALDTSSRWIFAYIDLVSAALAEEFAMEQAQAARSVDRRRSATVRAILSGELTDEAEASKQLGRDLGRAHFALHVWAERADETQLERASSQVSAALGGGTPLTVAGGVGALDVWFTCAATAAGELPPSAIDLPEGVCVAIGGEQRAAGIEGFRRAHREAHEAARVRQLAGATLDNLIRHSDIELAALLSHDLVAARSFTQHTLGPLAQANAAAERLRETLLAYLLANRSATQAAKTLIVHQNTVGYRIRQIEEQLDRPISERQPELLCALILAPLVLGPAEQDAHGSARPSQPS